MSKQPIYGPDNPHPLSTLKTQIVWEGKFDEYGNQREVDMAGCAMPMQKIETIDQPRSEAAAAGQLALFEKQAKRLDDFRNQLIWGDNKLVMASLLNEYKGKIDLIYIDPPFDVGNDFTMKVDIGDKNETIEKEQSTLEMVAFKDTWGKGTDSYLHFMYERLLLMRDLLNENGSIYVHCDWRVNYLLRNLLNDIFANTNFRNEIIWFYPDSPGRPYDKFPPKHDTIYRYSKSSEFVFRSDDIRIPILEASKKRYEKPRTLINSQGIPYEYIGGKSAEIGKVPETVWQIPVVKGTTTEDCGYDTQKPAALLDRIIKSSSTDDALVADFFCGSGTTIAEAEKHGRRWIGADLGRFAIHTSRKRLIDLQRQLYREGKQYRAFDVYNLGRYERQWWIQDQLKGADDEHRRVVLEFFRAEILTNTSGPLIHGRKGTSLCHVADIDSIFTRSEAREVANAVAQAGGKECYCLAWEFEMDLNLTTNALEKEHGVKLKLIQIPREIMEKNRKSPPPFLEMALLEAIPVYKTTDKGRVVDIKLARFIPSLAEVPAAELESFRERATKSGMDFIDFWAIDFDWKPGKPFNHHWQDYRTHKDRSLKTVSDAGFKYSQSGKYTACIKVIDTFGCDTSIVVEVSI